MIVNLIRLIEFREKKSFHPRDIIPSFELLTLASLLKTEHQLKLFDNEVLQLSSQEMQHILLQNPANIYIFHLQPAVEAKIVPLIRMLKEKSAIVIVFGSGLSPETAQNFLKKSRADYAVFDEVELSIAELIATLQPKKKIPLTSKQKIKGIAFLNHQQLIINQKRPFLDPNKLPFLSHELINPKQYRVVSKIIQPKEKIRWGFLLTSRGCPYRCMFCSPSIRNSIGKQYRAQNPERTVAEIELMINQFGINAISFEDDLFTFDEKRVIKICQLILAKKLHFSWTIATRLNHLSTQTLRIMKKAGCTGMSLGVETTNNHLLKIIKKDQTKAEIIRGIKNIHRAGITCTVNLIIGLPEQKLIDLKETLAILKKLQVIFLHLHYLTPYPGTEIAKLYHSESQNFTNFSHWQSHEFNISQIPNRTIKKIMSKMYWQYYFNWTYFKTYSKTCFNYWRYDPGFAIKFLGQTTIYLLFKKK